MLVQVLFACDDPKVQRRLRGLLRREDVVVRSIRAGKQTWPNLLLKSANLLFVSRSLIPAPSSDSLAALKALPDSPEVVILWDEDDSEAHARLLAAGAGAVLNTELPADVLRDVMESILERERDRLLVDLEVESPLDLPRLSDFISNSSKMQSFMSVVERLVNNDSTLLISGETGVGKEHLARAIHNEGPRTGSAFVSINCGALPESLLESELFGHEEGAFTGANRTRRGRFELAHKGTVFLDEIGEMPLHLQVKLLHVLQRREVQRIGGDRNISVDVRIMAATNRQLEEEIEAKRFRSDLFYRLSVVSLVVPPLRERIEDIADIVASYITHFQKRFASTVEGIADRALEALTKYPWPGNVRELINIIERAMLLSGGNEIDLEDLPDTVSGRHVVVSVPGTEAKTQGGNPASDEWLLEHTLREVRAQAIEDVERRYLTTLLRSTEGRIGDAADRAGVQPRSLFDKLRQYDIKKEHFKPGARRRARPS